MKQPIFAPLNCNCPQCGSPMALSVELIEYMVSSGQEENGELEKAIQEAIEATNHRDRMIKMADAPFPVALDVANNQICWLGWCSICKKPGMAGITPDELDKFLTEERKDRGL